MAHDARFHLHHSDSLSPLLDALADILREQPADPFAAELVVVPTAGIADAAMAGLAQRLGICANVEFVYPGQFISRAIGRHSATVPDPWQLPQLGWAVLEALRIDATDVPGVDANGVTWPLARHIADLFDRYATQRPELIRAWAAQHGVAQPVFTDGAGTVLGDDHAWQPRLWCRVRDLIGTPSVPEWLPNLPTLIASGDVTPQLPARVSVFGVSSLPPTLRAVIEALTPTHDMYVFLEYPSPRVWEQHVKGAPGTLIGRDPTGTGSAGTVATANHPLLLSWGRPAIETHAVLRGDPAVCEHPLPVAATTPTSLLAALQHDIRNNLTPSGYASLTANDGSIQVHACHGAQRQIEALRDALGHCFVADPTLQPHDVIVLCPDLERFAPLIPAIFARGDLPVAVRVGDRSLTSAQPMAQAVLLALSLATTRASLSEVLALLQFEPIRRRFGLDHTAIEQFTGWASSLGLKWGFDGDHRAGAAGIPASLREGTWTFVLDRLLAGVAMAAPEARQVLGEVAPYGNLSTDHSSVVGAVVEMVRRLHRFHVFANTSHTVAEWVDRLHQFVDEMVAADTTDRLDLTSLHRDLRSIESGAAVGTVVYQHAISLYEVRTLLEQTLDERPGRLSLRSGAVTVTSMAPQHGVPARVICILGLDDGVIRSAGFDGDDLLALKPCLGERNARHDARQGLLDTLLDAGERLIITCNGADLTTNRPVPFTTALAELLDAVAATASSDSAVPVVQHPRHGFHASELVPNGITSMVEGPLTFDRGMLAAAAALRAVQPAALSSWRLSANPVRSFTLSMLTEAFSNPAKALLKERLNVRLPGDDDDLSIDDRFQFSVEALERSQLARELLALHVQQQPTDTWKEQTALEGALPPRAIGAAVLTTTEADVQALVDLARSEGVPLSGTTLLRLDITIETERAGAPDTVSLVDDLEGVLGSDIAVVEYVKFKPSMMLSLALKVAVATLTDPDIEWTGHLVCRGDKSPIAHSLTMAGTDTASRHEAASRFVAMAIEFHQRATSSALPYLNTTSHALALNGTPTDDAFDTDTKYNDWLSVVWPDLTLHEFTELSDARHTAQWVWGTFTDVVVCASFVEVSA